VRWAIITGEYPPQPGGVSDYTRMVARGLAAAGDDVRVWAPDARALGTADPGVAVYPLSPRFDALDLARLGRALDSLPRPYRLLVQYVPHAFGWKAMNLPFCLWLLGRRRDGIWIMFHEVAFPLRWARPLPHIVLGVVTRMMAAVAARAAERIFVSIPAWESMLRRVARCRRPVTWLPIPSSLPSEADPSVVAATRARLAPGRHETLIGHFGTFGRHIAPLLAAILPPLVEADAGRRALLVGRGGREFVVDLLRRHPKLAERVHAPGELPADTAAAHLAACDLLVQPYPDGVSSRRTSLMAGLALGLPIVTNEGPLTEPLWRDTCGVVLVADASPAAFASATDRLSLDGKARAELGVRARALYAERFALKHTLKALRG
jgi:glycosyltransferase involved in cell wall biosynthesis